MIFCGNYSRPWIYVDSMDLELLWQKIRPKKSNFFENRNRKAGDEPIALNSGSTTAYMPITPKHVHSLLFKLPFLFYGWIFYISMWFEWMTGFKWKQANFVKFAQCFTQFKVCLWSLRGSVCSGCQRNTLAQRQLQRRRHFASKTYWKTFVVFQTFIAL